MARMPLRLITVGVALAQVSSAILVGTGSPCGVSCGNVLDSTSVDDIVCREDEFSGISSAGTVFKNCLNCEARSTFSTDKGKPASSDLQAMLYNMRYATSHCIFDFGTNPCIISPSCEPLKNALQYENLAPNVTTYGYCSQWNKAQVPKCQACLQGIDGGDILNNYLQVLTGACDLLIKPPQTIPIEGDIFDASKLVQITAPTPTGTFSGPQMVGPFNYGQLAGIVIGGVIGVLIVLGCCVVVNGKRRRKEYLKKRGQLGKGQWPSPKPQSEMFETPVSQKPLRGWGDSPVSAVDTEHTFQQYYTSPVSPYNHSGEQQHFPRYFSPYSSQYNSPSSAVEPPRNIGWPLEKTVQQQQHAGEIGVAVSPDNDESVYWGDSKGKSRLHNDEQYGYELQEGVGSGGGHQYPYIPPPPPQAPVLSHPGYGRHGNTPPGTAGR